MAAIIGAVSVTLTSLMPTPGETCINDGYAFAQASREAVAEHDASFFERYLAPGTDVSMGQFSATGECWIYGGRECEALAGHWAGQVANILKEPEIETRLVCESDSDPENRECWMTFALADMSTAELQEADAYMRLFMTTRIRQNAGCWTFAPDYGLFGAGAGNPTLEDYG